MHRLATTIALALTILAVIGVPAAFGHSAQLQAIDPPEGSTLDSHPATIRVTYTAPVELRQLAIELPDGRRQELVAIQRGAVATIELPPLHATGTTTLTWQVPQGDGHVVDYEHEFTIGEGALDPALLAARYAIDQAVSAMRSALARL